MKKAIRGALFGLIFILGFRPTGTYAYTDQDIPAMPKITQFNIAEQGRILHDGDRIHISFKFENSKHRDTITLPFVSYGVDDNQLKERMLIDCNYSDVDQLYHGISDPLNANMYEGRYGMEESSYHYRLADAGNPNAEYETIDINECSGGFIYNNNCYKGTHNAKELACGELRCTVCNYKLKDANHKWIDAGYIVGNYFHTKCTKCGNFINITPIPEKVLISRLFDALSFKINDVASGGC